MAHGEFRFKGRGLSFFWLAVWTSVLTVLTAGLFWPWANSAQLRWIAERTFVDGKQLTFKGSGLGFFGTWLLVLVLTIITLGIYLPWGYCRILRWQTNNLHYADGGDVEQF